MYYSPEFQVIARDARKYIGRVVNDMSTVFLINDIAY